MIWIKNEEKLIDIDSYDLIHYDRKYNKSSFCCGEATEATILFVGDYKNFPTKFKKGNYHIIPNSWDLLWKYFGGEIEN